MSAHIVITGDFGTPLRRIYLQTNGMATASWHRRGRWTGVLAWNAAAKANMISQEEGVSLRWVVVPEIEMMAIPQRRRKDRT